MLTAVINVGTFAFVPQGGALVLVVTANWRSAVTSTAVFLQVKNADTRGLTQIGPPSKPSAPVANFSIKQSHVTEPVKIKAKQTVLVILVATRKLVQTIEAGTGVGTSA